MLQSPMCRSFRRLVAVLTLMALVTVQGTVAAYACTAIIDRATSAMPAVGMVEAMPDCAGMHDNVDAALCAQHCGQGHDANSTLGTADVPAPALTRCLTVEPTPMQVTASTLAGTCPPTRSTSPPPLLLSQRLRI